VEGGRSTCVGALAQRGELRIHLQHLGGEDGAALVVLHLGGEHRGAARLERLAPAGPRVVQVLAQRHRLRRARLACRRHTPRLLQIRAQLRRGRSQPLGLKVQRSHIGEFWRAEGSLKPSSKKRRSGGQMWRHQDGHVATFAASRSASCAALLPAAVARSSSCAGEVRWEVRWEERR